MFKLIIKFLIINILSTSIILNSSLGAIKVVNFGDSIQEAINEANLDDIISINKGEYFENIVINKTIRLQGNKRPIIKGMNKGPTITISASDVKMEGLHIVGSNSSNSSTCILIKSERDNISGNEISDCYYGIRLQNKGGNIILNNNIKTCDIGIFGKASQENNITQNLIDSFIGITILDSSDGNTIVNNTMRNYQLGIGIYNSKNNTVKSNDITTKSCCIAANSRTNVVYPNYFNCPDHVCEVKDGERPPIFIRDRRRFSPENSAIGAVQEV